MLGVADDELRPALAKLAKATGSVTEAQKLATQAMDIATATGKPLNTVVTALEKAYGGNMTALTKLAPEYRDLIKDGASFEEVMSMLAKTTGGAATDAANTAITNGNITLGNTTVGLGNTATSLGNLTLANATISSGTMNVSIINSTANVTANATFLTSSLPLDPEGYVVITLNGVAKKIPYYSV